MTPNFGLAKLVGFSSVRGLICDLDGTVYNGESLLPGVAAFLDGFRKTGGRVVFATNRANVSPEGVARKLTRLGLPCAADEVLTSGLAAAPLCARRRAFVVGEKPLRDALRSAGAVLVEENPEIVVVGFERDLTMQKLHRAARFIYEGARFFATNRDAFIWENGVWTPENGPIVAYLEAATAISPLVCGKPEAALFEAALKTLNLGRESVAVLGDNLETDILGANRAGLRSIWTLTGVGKRADLQRSKAQPTWILTSCEAMF